MEYLPVYLIFGALISGAFGIGISSSFNVSQEKGFIFGFTLGPIGWILIGMLPRGKSDNVPRLIPKLVNCKHCSKTMDLSGLSQGDYECPKCKFPLKIS